MQQENLEDPDQTMNEIKDTWYVVDHFTLYISGEYRKQTVNFWSDDSHNVGLW